MRTPVWKSDIGDVTTAIRKYCNYHLPSGAESATVLNVKKIRGSEPCWVADVEYSYGYQNGEKMTTIQQEEFPCDSEIFMYSSRTNNMKQIKSSWNDSVVSKDDIRLELFWLYTHSNWEYLQNITQVPEDDHYYTLADAIHDISYQFDSLEDIKSFLLTCKSYGFPNVDEKLAELETVDAKPTYKGSRSKKEHFWQNWFSKNDDALDRRQGLKDLYNDGYWKLLDEVEDINDPKLLKIAPRLFYSAEDIRTFLLECARENLPGARDRLIKLNRLMGINSSRQIQSSYLYPIDKVSRDKVSVFFKFIDALRHTPDFQVSYGTEYFEVVDFLPGFTYNGKYYDKITISIEYDIETNSIKTNDYEQVLEGTPQEQVRKFISNEPRIQKVIKELNNRGIIYNSSRRNNMKQIKSSNIKSSRSNISTMPRYNSEGKVWSDSGEEYVWERIRHKDGDTYHWDDINELYWNDNGDESDYLMITTDEGLPRNCTPIKNSCKLIKSGFESRPIHSLPKFDREEFFKNRDKERNNPYDEGYEAFSNGLSITDNPNKFKISTRYSMSDWDLWELGYKDAEKGNPKHNPVKIKNTLEKLDRIFRIIYDISLKENNNDLYQEIFELSNAYPIDETNVKEFGNRLANIARGYGWDSYYYEIKDLLNSSLIKSSYEEAFTVTPWDTNQVTGTSDEDLGLSYVVEAYGNEFVNVDDETLNDIRNEVLLRYFDNDAFVRDWNINNSDSPIESVYDIEDPEDLNNEELARYFDYEAYGRDLRLENNMVWDSEEECWVSAHDVDDNELDNDKYIFMRG